MTNPDREELVKLEAERAELIAKNEAATSWGAAVGARSERIKGLDGRIATLRRLASSDGGVKVRELEWGPYPNPVLACDDVAVANTPVFGGHIYQVQRDPNAAGYIAFLAPQFGSLFWESKGHATLEAAKAAAQTDYEARIKSALVEVPAVKGEPEPYAYEYGKSNGDGTYSVVIERPPLRSQVSDRPTKPLYAAQPADAGMREALSQFDVEDYVASYEFRDIGGEAGDHVPTDSERVLITDAIHGAIAEIEAALTAPGATTKSDGGVEGHAIPRTTSATTTRYPEMEGERNMVATARRTEEYSSTKTGQAGVEPGPSDLCSDSDCEDQGLCPTDVCTKFECQQWVDDVRIRPALVLRGKYWVCPKCHSSYGEDAKGRTPPSTSDPSSTRSEVTALADIAAERQRQREVEGWTPEHDDAHVSAELAMAGACYALASFLNTEHALNTTFTRYWPWDRKWWKPKTPRENLVRAGALIVAEIERLDRLDQFEIRRK